MPWCFHVVRVLFLALLRRVRDAFMALPYSVHSVFMVFYCAFIALWWCFHGVWAFTVLPWKFNRFSFCICDALILRSWWYTRFHTVVITSSYPMAPVVFSCMD